MTGSARYVLPLLLLGLSAGPAWSQVQLGDLCRIKGQEENTLIGMGLVVGLQGTGDGDRPATRALAQTMMNLGTNLPRTQGGDFDLSELKNAKNVALVFVTATIPPSGARQGGWITCTVSAIGAKSLAGGTLLVTPLLGPHPRDKRIYALAQGALKIEDPLQSTVAKIHEGCQLQEDFVYDFHREGYVTLVLKENHAGFPMARTIQDAINQYFSPHRTLEGIRQPINNGQLATARDSKNILVRIPEEDLQNPVNFVAELLGMSIEIRAIPGTRVTVSERSQIIVVGEEVAIRPVAIAHKNITVEAGGQRGPTFSALERVQDSADPTFQLRSLVNALNSLKVDTGDMIEIIKALDREGALLGQLIVE
jgi:flagellar P-ring protein FlgI